MAQIVFDSGEKIHIDLPEPTGVVADIMCIARSLKIEGDETLELISMGSSDGITRTIQLGMLAQVQDCFDD